MPSEAARKPGDGLSEEALANRVAESFTPTEAQPTEASQPIKTEQTDTQRELQAAEKTIKQLPETAAKVARTVTKPVVEAAEKAIKPTNPEKVIAEAIKLPSSQQADFINKQRLEHLQAHEEDLKAEQGMGQ